MYALNNIHSHSVKEKDSLQIHKLMVSGHMTIVLNVFTHQYKLFITKIEVSLDPIGLLDQK